MCELNNAYFKLIRKAVLFWGVVVPLEIAANIFPNNKKYRVVENPDELGFWLEEIR
jgi:hypothetical protein